MPELGQLALVLALLVAVGLVADRLGQSPIPAYVLAGVLLGPHGPGPLRAFEPSEALALLAELGLVFILFFLGLEFSLDRIAAAGRLLVVGGAVDLAVSGTAGLAAGLLLFGPSLAALVAAAVVYISSSGVIVKALSDFRRLADPETDLVLAVLVVEDVVIALFLAFVGTVLVAGEGATATALAADVGLALLLLAAFFVLARRVAGVLSGALERLPREFFALGAGAAVVGIAALFEELGLSAAFGAILAGVLVADSPVRGELELGFLAFRDLLGAVFFFAFGLAVDVGPLLGSAGEVAKVAAAVVLAVAAKLAAGTLAGRMTGLPLRRAVAAGCSLVARGEFSVVLGQLALGAAALTAAQREDLSAFAGVLVLVTAFLGVSLLQHSRRIGRAVEGALAPTGLRRAP